MANRSQWREGAFLASVWLKGLNGLLEFLGGIALLSVTPSFILNAIGDLTQDEVVEDPHDFVANALLRIAAHVDVSSKRFVAFYLLIHGVVKLGLVWALL